MNIIDVANNRDEIMSSQEIYCPLCGEKQFAPFDKLFTKTYDRCVDCTPAEQLEIESENVFAIL